MAHNNYMTFKSNFTIPPNKKEKNKQCSNVSKLSKTIGSELKNWGQTYIP